MKQEALTFFTDIHLTVVGMFIFLFAFVLITIRVSRKDHAEHYKIMGQLPLESEPGEQR